MLSEQLVNRKYGCDLVFPHFKKKRKKKKKIGAEGAVGRRRRRREAAPQAPGGGAGGAEGAPEARATETLGFPPTGPSCNFPAPFPALSSFPQRLHNALTFAQVHAGEVPEGNNDAVIKTSLWPRVHVFAELGRVRLAHRERARLSSTPSRPSPAATRAVPLWAAGSPARAPRAGSVGLGEGDFAEASRSEPTKKRKIFPAPPRSARPGMGVHWH